MANPFHDGEIKMQLLSGESREAEMNAPMIASRIAKGAVPFLSARQFAALSVEKEKELWCTHMIGEPGFIGVSNQSRLSINLRMLSTMADPMILAAADRNAAVGSIFIDLETRIRYRINGKLSRPDENCIELQVREAYGNCPKYITRRLIEWHRDDRDWSTCAAGRLLSEKQQDSLKNADLFFVATSHPEHGLDASHRGGYPGFVCAVDERTLLFRDYPGNSLFNSLGNLMVDERIGLLVPDLTRRMALRITGTAVVEFHDTVRNATTSNATWLVRVSVSRWDEVNLPVESSRVLDYSPFNP